MVTYPYVTIFLKGECFAVPVAVWAGGNNRISCKSQISSSLKVSYIYDLLKYFRIF